MIKEVEYQVEVWYPSVKCWGSTSEDGHGEETLAKARAKIKELRSDDPPDHRYKYRITRVTIVTTRRLVEVKR